MTKSPIELPARARAAADAALAQPGRAHWGRVEREAFSQAFVEQYLAVAETGFEEARRQGAAAERQRYAEIVAHPAFKGSQDEVLALASTGGSAADLRPLLDGLQASGGLAGHA